MKWTYSIKNKSTAAILLAIILGLTMLTNLLERKRFKELEESFTSIYEDRLLAENYLFHMYDNLKKKQDLFELAAQKGVCHTINADLNVYRQERGALIEKYEQTYLTDEEDGKFNDLKVALNQIDELEEKISDMEAEAQIPQDLIRKHDEITIDAFTTLSALSDIQTAEGELLRNKSKQIILGSVSISHFEMTILIVIAIIIQALVFSSSTLLVKKNQRAELN
ncbi:MCP four helix bundle domain-containing protein [Flavilitoribacter nigricans]|uniref:Chemotaxis methyl-accepting receptor HlyB-like 4HB MCP domain-containing protein n=1 Tax=Flavilitoribacter nigricans (strain ATCC 23147 / DSM 23189 / NBRC 102662 / NCIMB 1420 / SS-2) TaxID=1122177 RepID=A0A2D0MXQ9_FLAN2|nr:MCP four helix bundle domain-containing protein [Flavilitoribacter nigricans]PHN00689.1 hypothetical protein CRP01_40920 [Flavilitoribacter nigricans DSM 23189 = NBRC 102662]